MTEKRSKANIAVFAGYHALAAGVTVRDALRADGYAARVIDADQWQPGFAAERNVHGLAFVGARNHVDIEAVHRAAFPALEVRHYGLDGKPVGDNAVNAMAPSTAKQPDALTTKLAAMGEADLRAFAEKKKVDVPPPPAEGQPATDLAALRATIETTLRAPKT